MNITWQASNGHPVNKPQHPHKMVPRDIGNSKGHSAKNQMHHLRQVGHNRQYIENLNRETKSGQKQEKPRFVLRAVSIDSDSDKYKKISNKF